MYIRDIEPIGNVGVELLNKSNAEEIIDRIIEEPLKKPINVLYKKGIKTVMSSANKNNVVPKGGKPKKKEDVEGREFFLDAPTFEDAGVGYAWIMLDFDTLSDENKEMLLRLEERKDEKGNKVGEEAIWFVKEPYGNIRKINFHFDLESETKSKNDEKPDEKYREFERRSIGLIYNDRYPANTVILRMPVDENTTVEEVEEYFCKIAEVLKNQRVRKVENNIEDKGR